MVADMDAESLSAVLRPKVAGSMVLDELFPAGSVDFMELFSSCGHLFRFPGQGAYGAANAFLDALARHRNATAHDHTISFGWSSWRGLGMSASSEFIAAELFRLAPTDGGPRRVPLTAELEVAAGGPEDEEVRTPNRARLSPGNSSGGWWRRCAEKWRGRSSWRPRRSGCNARSSKWAWTP